MDHELLRPEHVNINDWYWSKGTEHGEEVWIVSNVVGIDQDCFYHRYFKGDCETGKQDFDSLCDTPCALQKLGKLPEGEFYLAELYVSEALLKTDEGKTMIDDLKSLMERPEADLTELPPAEH
ncbi:hypothetical protein ACFL96_03250 [Thermoproteota archaeon]